MNDSEIIKALECCRIPLAYKRVCNNLACKFNVNYKQCNLDDYALDLIKRQQAEIDRLNIDLKAMRGAANSWKAEVQRICKKEFDNIEIDIETVKSEAVMEFAESLKRKSELVAPSVWAIPYRAVAVADIDKFLEERGCNDE